MKSKKKKPNLLWVDQWGVCYHAPNITRLKKQERFTGKISKTYVDGADGQPKHVGYCIGKLWFRTYTPYEWNTLKACIE